MVLHNNRQRNPYVRYLTNPAVLIVRIFRYGAMWGARRGFANQLHTPWEDRCHTSRLGFACNNHTGATAKSPVDQRNSLSHLKGFLAGQERRGVGQQEAGLRLPQTQLGRARHDTLSEPELR
jgi:hypothetical protein